MLVCLSRKSPANELFVQNGVFALNTLGEAHDDVAHAFSGLAGLDADGRFSRGRWTTLATGSPALEDAIAVFDCELMESKDVATHRILFGKVVGLRIGESLKPLIYHKRAYHLL